MKGSSEGMTLIEVLVALTALSLLAAGMIATFQVGHRTYDRILKVDQSYADVVVAQRFLRRSIQSAYPFDSAAGPVDASGLEGTAERLQLTTPANAADHSSGFRRVTLALVRRGDGLQNLVVTSRVDRNGVDAAPDLAKAGSEVLVPRVKGVEWTYLDAGRETDWQSSWTQRHLPALVRLRVNFPAGDTRRWPDLVVGTSVTDDANCDFDVVSQACRQAGL